jgi:glycine oxidase
MAGQAAAQRITVAGAGIGGLWAALTLAERGYAVRLVERSAEPLTASASRLAGAMLAPYCEAEAAERSVRDAGIEAMAIWRRVLPEIACNGSLVVAPPRDVGELRRFLRMTQQHELVDAERIAALEPDLAGRFNAGLYFPGEGHMAPEEAMRALLEKARAHGVEIVLGQEWQPGSSGEDWVIDCRGLAARRDLAGLRGVRGERLVLQTSEVRLARPVRLLHPRFPLYIVPWSEGRFMVGATVIESEDAGPVSVRSALELLGAAYAVHPAFGEARIVEVAAGVRPAFADNVPRVVVDGRRIHINGFFRHGFLLAPKLAELAAEVVETGKSRHELVVVR